ncbi:hypothetical protein Q73A0000_02525 [Kaistella flava (ex Peng et al. 2021)]|uniref:Uncharacterized protein n=1 Tax=Kaistella flava (ex Peng et al. 2021) TaxID=2038776 RepID=A0A7M2Y560_9FLAO|nr:hypothetical protein [Kaistella flava (ex Peng et al. 2021)]QOW09311.1 hypothetical protein Q73A0000_02525 [Kaistella flava (ex Peng et al. 2021)]
MRVDKIQDLFGKVVKIIDTQTTYVIVNFQNENYHINFDAKKEFYLKKGNAGTLEVELNHPLLIDYQEDHVETFINSAYPNSRELLKKFENTINEQTKGFRNWKNYFEIKNINFTLEIIKNNIEKGTGKLCLAPISISDKIVEQCDLLKIKTKTFKEKNYSLKPYKLLRIGDNYVIAKYFNLKD